MSAADGETAPLPRIFSSSHSNSRRCGRFLIRQRLGSGCCQLLLALGAKDHHPLVALTSRMGAGICRALHRSSLAWARRCRAGAGPYWGHWERPGGSGREQRLGRGTQLRFPPFSLQVMEVLDSEQRGRTDPFHRIFQPCPPSPPGVIPVGKLSHGAVGVEFGGTFSELRLPSRAANGGRCWRRGSAGTAPVNGQDEAPSQGHGAGAALITLPASSPARGPRQFGGGQSRLGSAPIEAASLRALGDWQRGRR